MRWLSELILRSSVLILAMPALSAEPTQLDPLSREQAELERKDLANGTPRSQSSGIKEFRKTAQSIKYPSGNLKLPGWLYRPPGNGPFPAVIWNHGSEKHPLAQAELARFYTQHGFVFLVPIREGHGKAPGEYILDLQKQILGRGIDAKALT